MDDFSTRNEGMLYSPTAEPLMQTPLHMGREPPASSSPISPLTLTKTEDLSRFLFPGQEDSNNKKQQLRRSGSLKGTPSNNDSHNHITNNHTTNGGKLISSVEIRRQIHVQSEQRRRAQIKDGFEELRNQLPACLNKKMSKVALLHRTVQHIRHLKSTQISILSELERLVRENEELRKFQASVIPLQESSLYSSSKPGSVRCSNTSTTTTTAQHQHHHHPCQSPLSFSSSIASTSAPISTQLYQSS